ncbi:MAG: MoaD/ThiS family protein [Oceanococcus sp.]
MNIILHPYGPLIEVLGNAPQNFDLTGNTAKDLVTELTQAFTGLRPWTGRIACAVGERILAKDDLISAGDEVALIPPVSGG